MNIKKSFIPKFFIIITGLISLFFTQSISGSVQKYALTFKIFPRQTKITINKKIYTPAEKVMLEPGEYSVNLSCPGYTPKNVVFKIQANMLLEDKLEKLEKNSYLKKIGEFYTMGHPKSAEFTPDGKNLIIDNLSAPAIQSYTILHDPDTFHSLLIKETLLSKLFIPEQYAKQEGFVETAFSLKYGEIWVSQMSTHCVHIFDAQTLDYKESIDVKGSWSKVILINDQLDLAFVSNWLSKDVSVISLKTRQVIKLVKLPNTPRGMELSGNLDYLYVCDFDLGTIIKVQLSDYKIVKTISYGYDGAKRHMVYDRVRDVFYVSDMAKGTISILSPEDKVLKEIRIAPLLNTIELSPDSRFLFISSRGPNNKISYLLKGPEFGKVFIIDVQRFKIITWIWGKNQPTGIDVSPDGRYLAFTDFLDNTVELYAIKLDKYIKAVDSLLK